MDKQRYEKIRQALYEKACEVSRVKGNDYTRGSEDVLQNFKSVAERSGLTPEEVILVYMDKHQDAIGNYIKSKGNSESEPIEMRIVDNINYLFLLWGLIMEKQDEKTIEENRENFFSKSKREETPTMGRPKTINILPDSDGKGYKIYVNGSGGSGCTTVRESVPTHPIRNRGEESGEAEHLGGAETSGRPYIRFENTFGSIQTEPQQNIRLS